MYSFTNVIYIYFVTKHILSIFQIIYNGVELTTKSWRPMNLFGLRTSGGVPSRL